MSKGLFYLQDSRTYVGNDMLFWAMKGGYTTDLSRAQKFTLKEAQTYHDSRGTDLPWPCEYIEAKTRPAVDIQYVKRRDVDNCGIVFAETKRVKQDVYNCVGCGRFVSVRQYFLACPSCGASYGG